MVQTLLGVKPVDFTDSKTNKHIEGTTIYTSFNSANVEGAETAKIFLAPNITPRDIETCIGCEIDVEYGQYGKVIQVTL